MSGITGIVYNDGCPVSEQLIRQMTRSLEFRGPDAQGVWAFGSAGLGYALLQTSPENPIERQPATLDHQIWIAADARLDAREELADALRVRGRKPSRLAPDCELMLHAYGEWGQDCVEHFRGDFVFAIWDAPRRKLFCACDHFGIKTLYYAELRNCLVFSNTLECVKMHPDVSERLNDAAIADFLLFGLNYDNGTTSFADIRRLPPAHALAWSPEGLRTRGYWMPPTDGHIRYRRRREYIEQFSELLKTAVEDRLPSDRAGVLLSGGLDSSSVAAIANELRKEKLPRLELHAFTTTCTQWTDDDAAAARIAAEALGLVPHTSAMDSRGIFERPTDEARLPEPIENPFAGYIPDEFGEIAKRVRVVLSGEGSDNLMEFEFGQHIRSLWGQRQISGLAADVAEHIVHRLRAPDGIRGPLRRIGGIFSRREMNDEMPSWLDSEIVKRLNLKSRWKNPLPEIPWKSHPVHPKGYGSLFLPHWTRMFQEENPGVTRQPVETRYPFLDLRVVSFLLAIPTMPWFFRKHILREGMRGKLPEKIRMRPKRTWQEDPIVPALREFAAREEEQTEPTQEFHRFGNLPRLGPALASGDSERILMAIRAMCLSYWLHSLGRIGYRMPEGAAHEEARSAAG